MISAKWSGEMQFYSALPLRWQIVKITALLEA